MVESISELKKRVQEPVRKFNDISGLLLGDHLSIYITRFFIARGWSPTLATMSMLVFGLAGSGLLLLGDRAAVVGFSLLFLHYIFDCVDGEVARYHKAEKVLWSFHDYLFHFYIKSAFFLCFGIASYWTTGSIWMFAAAWAGFSAAVFGKFVRELPALLASRLVLQRGAGPEDPSYRQLTEVIADEDLEEREDVRGTDAPAPYGGLLSKARSFLTNFDLMIVVFFFVSIADLFVDRFEILGVMVNLKVTLFVVMAVLQLCDFLDRMIHSARTGEFARGAGAILLRAHHFRVKR